MVLNIDLKSFEIAILLKEMKLSWLIVFSSYRCSALGKIYTREAIGEKIWDDEDYEIKKQVSNLMKEIF